jgi:hypothetical protein
MAIIPTLVGKMETSAQTYILPPPPLHDEDEAYGAHKTLKKDYPDIQRKPLEEN